MAIFPLAALVFSIALTLNPRRWFGGSRRAIPAAVRPPRDAYEQYLYERDHLGDVGGSR